MPVIWNLRGRLKERGITRASEISRIIRERTGYHLSVQAVCDLLNGEPKMVRIETIEAFCDAFYFRLSDFFEVVPIDAQKPQQIRRRRERPGSLKAELGQLASGAGGKHSQKSGSSAGIGRVDFAAFYPDARKFS
ncbi:MAG TPA: helix-turn-helix transcriptional regulator [Pyrinomonadaceae bacterium]|nr:helix-turn-helix transcriptional regulator [Pyrinomonadaceae bacterium]